MLNGLYMETGVIHRTRSLMHAAVCQRCYNVVFLYSYSHICTFDLFWITKLFTTHPYKRSSFYIYFNKMTYFPLQRHICMFFCPYLCQ